MRWPFGSPHLTLKPSKIKHKNKKRNKESKRKNKKKPRKKEATKKRQKYPKISFSVISQIFHFFGWFFKISLFWHLGPESAHPKNTIKIGVSGPFFWKADVRHETAIFGPKKPKFINFSYHFFAYFLLFQQQKTPKIAETPIFIVFLANQKKRIFNKNNLKHWKLKKKTIFAPLFWKRLFLDNWKITENKKKKHKMITEHPKNHLKPLFLLCENDVAQLVTINVAQLVTIKMAKHGPVSNFTAHICMLTGA